MTNSQKPAPDAMREAVKRAVCCPDGCQYEGDSEDGGTCYCDTTDYHGSGVEKRANAVFASLSAPVPPPDGPSYGDMRAKIGLYAMLSCIGDPDKTDHDVARILREYEVAIREFAAPPVRDREAMVPPVKRVECVQGFLHEEPADPVWRIEINGIVADFPTETWANNFRNAILSLAVQSGADDPS